MIALVTILQLLIVFLVSESEALQYFRNSSASYLPANKARKSYVCPPNFIRLGHRCYFFSKDIDTWQNAYFRCKDLRSNLAIIRNANQDKIVRRVLNNKSLAPLERWIGGFYDWKQNTWKWAASGLPLEYHGFPRKKKEKNKLHWQCIVLDPKLKYRWSSRSCVERKHFVCHTKIKIVNNREKLKLKYQYNVNKYNKLNEIPVPELPNDNTITNHKINKIKKDRKSIIRNKLAGNTTKVKIPTSIKRKHYNYLHNKRGEKSGGGTFKENIFNTTISPIRATNLSFANAVSWRRQNRQYGSINRTDRTIPMFRRKIQWKSYLSNATVSPLHPRLIVDEYNFYKEP